MGKWILDVYSWSGLSLDAIHYYVDLTNYERKIFIKRLYRPLTESMAKSINKRLKHTYAEQYYELYEVHPGEMDYRFENFEDAKQAGIEKFMEIADCGDILVEDNNRKEIVASK